MSYCQRCVCLIALQSFLLFVARLPWALGIASSSLLLTPQLIGRTWSIEVPRLRSMSIAFAWAFAAWKTVEAVENHEQFAEAARSALSQTLPWSIALQIFLVWTASPSWRNNLALTATSFLTLLGLFVLLSTEISVYGLQGMVTASLPVALWLAAPDGERGRQQAKSASDRLTRRDWLMASVYVAGVWYARIAWDRTVRHAQAAFPEWAAALEGQRRARRAYVRTGALTSVTREQLSEPMQIALRVYSKRSPGYLRGRIFDTYERSQWSAPSARRGRWNQSEGRKVRTPLGRRPPGLANADPHQPIFLITEPTEGPLLKMEIHNDPARDEVFFLPLSSAYLQGEGSFLAVDAHGAIHTGIRTDHPYSAYVARHTRTEALTPSMRERLVASPSISTDIHSLAEMICRDATTTEARIRAVVSYFHANYIYSDQGVVVPSGSDPLGYFLLQRPAAHCEYFATGAAVLLRAMNIPCRYVTGYIVTELESEFGDYWVARNRNAHAWAEAFDEARQRWMVVEATPGIRLPEGNLSSNSDLAGDSANTNWQVDMLGSRSPWLWRIRWTNVAPAAALAASILLILRSDWLRRRIAKVSMGGDDRASVHFRRQALLRKFEKWLAGQGYSRHASMTLHQFANELRNKNSTDRTLNQAAQWLERYAKLRYSTSEPANEGADAERELREAFRELRHEA